ncbi:MAG: universal stress protein [Desulfovibrionaceae bacterium]|nr:universal stress protein [Desulfovibrionaceae bacterium]MBF0514171.1 universal stress protein [Desulfovibrionaceae bacterium]
MLKTILVAVDSSAQHAAILDQATELAIAFGSSVHVVSVADTVSKGTVPMVYPSGAFIESLNREAQAVLKAACHRLSEHGVPCRTHALAGPVAQRVVELAVELDADLIVIGHRHLSWMQRLLENSVGRNLLDQSPCNVLVVIEAADGA